jgi:hypothetical protein
MPVPRPNLPLGANSARSHYLILIAPTAPSAEEVAKLSEGATKVQSK